MTSTNDIGLATERVRCSTEIDLNDLHCSTICENILWKPIACQECETHFCSMCIEKWLRKNPNQCPMRCDSFIQRPCSKFIVRQLAKLQIVCIYQPNGCSEIVPYEALEKHEIMCGYRLVKCTGCLVEMLQNNLPEHRCQSSSTLTTCENEQFRSLRHEPQDEIQQLKEQLRQVQSYAQYEIQQLRVQLRQAQDDQATSLLSCGIIANENIVKRIPLQSTVEMHRLSRSRIYPDTNSCSVLTDQLVCSTCGDVLWKPVCCGKCGTTFCENCRPEISIFNKIATFFGSKGPEHGLNRCKNFEEVPVPNHIMVDLARLRVGCAYTQNGCPVISLYNDLERHERQCEFERIPCQLCQLPLSKRPPIVQHTTRACFEEMRRKNPAGIQQQFMILLDATQKAEAENRRLEAIINNLQTQLNTLNSTCVKKPVTEHK